MVALSGITAQPDLNVPEDSLPQLQRLIEHAVTQSPQMILRGFDEAAADGALTMAKAARLPSLGGSVSVLRAREDRGDFLEPQPADKTYYSVSATQPLFHWGMISRNIENAKLRREMESGRTKQAYMTMISGIRGKYLELMIQKKIVERYRFWMELLDQELEEAIEKRALNTLSEAQLQQVQLKHKRGLASVAYNEEQYLSTKRILSRMVGVESISDEEIADEFPVITPDEDAAKLSSLLARFSEDSESLNTELQIMAKTVTTLENDLKNSRVNLRPRINLTAGMTQDEQSYTANIAQRYEYQSLFAGVSVYWTVFDGFATRGSIKAALNRLRSAETNLEMTEERLVEDAESYARQLKYRAIEVEVANQELVNAENHLKFIQQQFERGEVSENDVAQARINLLDNWRGTMSTRLGYWQVVFAFLGIIEADPAIDLLPAHRL